MDIESSIKERQEMEISEEHSEHLGFATAVDEEGCIPVVYIKEENDLEGNGIEYESVIDANFGEESFNEEKTSQTGKNKKIHQCKLCEKAYRSPKELQAHESSHMGEKLYQCEICSKRYFSSSSLYNHKRIIHMGGVIRNKSHQCDLCPQSFVSASHLEIHKRRHTGERPFTCEICGKSFCESSTLYKHMRTHSKEKRFQCKQCLKCFTASSSLVVHERIHNGEKPFQCVECGECFQTPAQLRTHERIHTGESKPKLYQCERCLVSFNSHKGLVCHTRAHTGENPFVCNLCGKTFTTSGNLKTHGLKAHSLKNKCKCQNQSLELNGDKCPKCFKNVQPPFEGDEIHKELDDGQESGSCAMSSMQDDAARFVKQEIDESSDMDYGTFQFASATGITAEHVGHLVEELPEVKEEPTDDDDCHF